MFTSPDKNISTVIFCISCPFRFQGESLSYDLNYLICPRKVIDFLFAHLFLTISMAVMTSESLYISDETISLKKLCFGRYKVKFKDTSNLHCHSNALDICQDDLRYTHLDLIKIILTALQQ